MTAASYRGRIHELDIIRAVGVFAVILAHIWPLTSYRPWLTLQLAWIMMDAFFVLSGFLITGILLDTRRRPDYYRSFYTRRALRILPVYYLALAAVMVAGYAAGGAGAGGAQSPWWYGVYLGNVPIALSGHLPTFANGSLRAFWSLQIEEQFYLLFPPLVRRLRTPALVRLLVALIATSLGLRVALYFWMPSNHLIQYVFLPCRMDGFALGALIAIGFRQGWQPSRWKVTVATLASTTAVLALGVASGCVLVAPAIRTVGYLLSSIASACAIVWLIVFRGSRVTACLRIRPVRDLAKISYGMYVLHFPIIAALGATSAALGSTLFARQSFSSVIVVPLLTVAAASLSWHWLENPLLSRRRRTAVAPATGGKADRQVAAIAEPA